MPLGKISKRQIQEAFEVLSSALTLLELNTIGPNTNTVVRELTNHFFTCIPHNFGTAQIPLLDNVDYIKVQLTVRKKDNTYNDCKALNLTLGFCSKNWKCWRA